jgi:L-threonylcarbamoyladenylate synthase
MDALEPASLLEQAARVVSRGGVVVVATETFYALAANPFDESALQRVFSLKGRLETKPLALIAASPHVLERLVARTSPVERCLVERFLPGSLTILLAPAATVSRLLVGPSGKIGIRVPPPCPARSLAERCEGCITATSANLSGAPEAATTGAISPEVLKRVDFIVDTGPTPGGKPSTVLELKEHAVRVVREGAIASSEIIAEIRERFPNKWS